MIPTAVSAWPAPALLAAWVGPARTALRESNRLAPLDAVSDGDRIQARERLPPAQHS
jgi:hypothetical protein